VARHLLNEAPEQPLDIERILADEKSIRVLDQFGNATATVGFPDSRHARIRVDRHEISIRSSPRRPLLRSR